MSNPEMIEDLKKRELKSSLCPCTAGHSRKTQGRSRGDRGYSRRKIDVMLITNAAQIDHVMQLVEQTGKTESLREHARR